MLLFFWMSFLPAKVQVNLSLLTSPRIDIQLDAQLQRQFFMTKNFKIHVPRVMVYVLGKHVQQQPNRKHEKISTLFVVLENKTQLKTNWNRKDSAHKQVKKIKI